MTYRYVQGIDYGPRDGTLGLSFHMSEGYDGLPLYLARHSGEDLHEWANRVNGVSCNAAILSTGEVVQMLDWGHASGNLNPDDRASEYGYYGHHHLADVLGTHWPDPNVWTVSAELAGYRAAGPTPAQVKAAIKWGLEMRTLFPSIRGATGHHDQSPKGCPGLTPGMKAIFAGVGGHGLWTAAPLTPPDTSTGDDVTIPIGNSGPYGVALTVGDQLYDQAFRPLVKVSAPQTATGYFYTGTGFVAISVVTGGKRQLVFVKAADVSVTPKLATDCTAAVKLATDPLVARIAGIKTKTAAFAADVAND